MTAVDLDWNPPITDVTAIGTDGMSYATRGRESWTFNCTYFRSPMAAGILASLGVGAAAADLNEALKDTYFEIELQEQPGVGNPIQTFTVLINKLKIVNLAEDMTDPSSESADWPVCNKVVTTVSA